MKTNYWEIEDFSGTSFSLFGEGEKIYSDKLTLKDVEEKIGKKLRVAKSWENPAIIVSARLEENGRKYIDARTSIRGTTIRYYMFK
jgi:hypothetical protein